jgi:hypothetical protein
VTQTKSERLRRAGCKAELVTRDPRLIVGVLVQSLLRTAPVRVCPPLLTRHASPCSTHGRCLRVKGRQAGLEGLRVVVLAAHQGLAYRVQREGAGSKLSLQSFSNVISVIEMGADHTMGHTPRNPSAMRVSAHILAGRLQSAAQVGTCVLAGAPRHHKATCLPKFMNAGTHP